MNNKETQNMATLEDAIRIAAEAHKGQTDKSGSRYILHPLRMMMKMKSETAMIVAVLHDVVEDTDWTFDKFREAGFSEEVLAALDGVTNRTSESYDQFIERAQHDPIIREVKIADLEDNMNMQRIEEVKPKDLERFAKYHLSWRKLTKAGSV